MLNRILLSHLNNTLLAGMYAMRSDRHEAPSDYKGWIYPFRYLLALRYLKTKQNTLDWFRANKIYPIENNDFKQAMIQRLSRPGFFTRKTVSSGNKNCPVKPPASAFAFKAPIFYSVLLAALLFSLWDLNQWYQQRRIQNVLANHLPYFSDLTHRKLMLRDAGNPSVLKKINREIQDEQQKILSDLPEKGGIRSLLAEQLKQLKDPSVSIKDILLGFKRVNTALDKQKIPYYLSPKSFSLPCSSFIDAPVEQMMFLKKLESLLSKNNPERCRTTMMTTYKVNQRKQLYYVEGKSKTELPLFLSTRIDKVPAVDSALGLTYKETGIGSLILLDRIQRFATESILPALTFQGRSYVIPYWMQGYYEIEESVTKSYKKDLKKIYHDKTELLKVKKAVKQLLRNKNRLSNARMQQTLQRNSLDNRGGPSGGNLFSSGLDAISVLLGKRSEKQPDKPKRPVTIPELSKLDDVLLPSIELHEAYHQIIKDDWNAPVWQKELFKKLDDDMTDHAMEELGAYLSQLANTAEGHYIWLSKLLIFSLNPMTKGQAEYYASGIILTSMKSLYQGKTINPRFDASVDEKTQIFKRLTSLPENRIRMLARQAYETLFERDVPRLTR